MPNPIALQFWVAAVAPPIAVGVSRFTLPSAIGYMYLEKKNTHSILEN